MAAKRVSRVSRTGGDGNGFSVSSEEYRKAFNSAELVSIVLVELRFVNDGSAYLAALKSDEATHAFDGYSRPPNFSEGTLVAEFAWSVTVTVSGKNKVSSTKVVEILAKYEAIYAFASDVVPEAAAAFAYRVGKLATFPYFRSLAATLGAAAGLPLPVLPVIRETSQSKILQRDDQPQIGIRSQGSAASKRSRKK